MPDMYGRGLGTGAWIGSMINPSRSGREAYLQAQHDENTLDKLSEGGLGAEFINGEWQLNTKGAMLYMGRPLHAEKALMNAPKRALEAHEKQLKATTDSLNVLEKVHTMNDKQFADIDKNLSLTPEQKYQAKQNVAMLSFNAAMKFIPDIMKREVTQKFIQDNQNLNNSEMQEGIFEANLLDYVGKTSDPGFQFRLEDLTNIATAYAGLSDEAKTRFKPTVDKLMATKPIQIAKYEEMLKGRELEQQKAKELSVARQREGIQTAGALEREKQKQAIGLSPAELAQRDLRGDPEAAQIIDKIDKREIGKQRMMKELKGEGGFASWTNEAKTQAFMENVITGKPPVNAQGFASNDRQTYGKEFAQWKVDKGLRPADVALMQSDYKAGDMSLKNMAKQEAPMSAFVLNINKQIAKVQSLYEENDRTGLRLLDLPIRELRVRAKGSGDEAVKASYLLEISNEIGKLSSGASASVQQLSDSAKEDWKKVHDVNLSLKEITKVLNATREQANMRIDTWREAKEEVRNSIRFMGGGGEQKPTEPTEQKVDFEYIPGKGLVPVKR